MSESKAWENQPESRWIFGRYQDLLVFGAAILFLGLSYGLRPFFPREERVAFFFGIGTFLGMSHTIAPALLLLNRRFRDLLADPVAARVRRDLICITGAVFVFYAVGLALFYATGDHRISILYVLIPPAIHIVWNFFHFGKQNFGIINLYNRKLNLPHSRRYEDGFCLLSAVVVGAQIVVRVVRHFFKLNIPAEIFIGLWVLSGAVVLIGVPILLTRGAPIGKRLCVLIVMLQPITLMFLTNIQLLIFTFPHWLAEIYLINRLHRHAKHPSGETSWHSVYAFALFAIVLGTAITLFNQHIMQSFSLQRFYALPIPLKSHWQADATVALLYLFAFAYGLMTYMHFYLDGVVYRGASYKNPAFLPQALKLRNVDERPETKTAAAG